MDPNRSTVTRIYLVRHGEVDNPSGILYGRLAGFRLTKQGQAQARAAAGFLAARPLAAIYSSPLLRARQTAAPIAALHPGLKPSISKLINEVLTPYEGLPGKLLDARQGDVYSPAGPGFEQPADIVRRLKRFLARVLNAHPGQEVAAVTHGDVVTFGVLWAKGCELIPQNKSRLLKAGFPAAYPVHASVTTMAFEDPSLEQRPQVDYIRPW